jgi:hypothetical protein
MVTMVASGLNPAASPPSFIIRGDMLRLRFVAFLAALLVACSTPSKPLDQVLPANVDGWTRAEVSPLDPAAAPDIIKQLGLKSSAIVTYKGPTSVGVRVYEMNAATSAFELIQKWPQRDGLAVYKNTYFLVAEPPVGAADPKLLESLRKHLP